MTVPVALSMMDRCEVISRWLLEKHGHTVSPVEVFNYSPTGELWKIFYWYKDAVADGFGPDRPTDGRP